MNYSEKGVTIRPPSTANLMIDSKDRGTQGTWGNFIINKPQSLFNGFFTRLGVTEVVLEWCQGNLDDPNLLYFTVTVGVTNYTVTLSPGFKTVETCLDEIVALLNAANIPGVGSTWSIVTVQGNVALQNSVPEDYDVVDTPLARKLGMVGTSQSATVFITCPDLRPYRYIDIVSTQLTYNQDLKDASTAPKVRDVLCRWYFDWDVPTQLDGYGFPILMGYTSFFVRRIFNPPKQIKWDSIQPLGQIAFEVYDDNGDLITNDAENQFLMTIQASEN